MQDMQDMRSIFLVFCGDQPDRVYYRNINDVFWNEKDAQDYVKTKLEYDPNIDIEINEYKMKTTDSYTGDIYVAILYDDTLYASYESFIAAYETKEEAISIIEHEYKGEKTSVHQFTPR